MAANTTIPDGVYTVDVSDTLIERLLGSSGKQTKTDEIFSFQYGEIPDSLDRSKTSTLNREKRESTDFKLNSESKDENIEAIEFKGKTHTTSDLECILVYNEKEKLFELENLDRRLETTSFNEKLDTKREKEITPSPMEKPSIQQPQPMHKKKRIVKEPSIFAPKVKPKSPIIPSSGSKKRSNSDEDELPLSRLSSQNRRFTPIPSPLNPAKEFNGTETSPEKRPIPTLKLANEPALSPWISNDSKFKTNSSAAATPTITQDENISDDDDFGALVDELEGGLEEDDFFTIDEGKTANVNKQSNGLGINTPKSGPTSFRSLAGVADQEEDVSSSEEE